MEAADLLARYATGHYKPATFLERGVALPFTTPYLMGGRVRPGDRGQPELVLANPAGVDGVYIIPWSALPDICAPTLHDRALWTRVSQLQLFSPRNIRASARAVAVEGYAGRDAARAAKTADEGSSQHRIILHYHMLLDLIRQGEPSDSGQPPPERDTAANVERRSRAVLERLRKGGNMSPAAAVETLEELALAFDGCGLRRNPTGARLPALCNEIAAVMQELGLWSQGATNEDRTCARLLIQSAELTLRCGRLALAGAHALVDDIWPLMRRWRVDPDTVLGTLSRAEWVLDGWDLICGVWRASLPAAKGAAALDMAVMVPVIPAEVRDWVGFDGLTEFEDVRSGLRRWRRSVLTNQDWMTGRFLDGTHRNETVRALAA